jgi:5'-nucleotidase
MSIDDYTFILTRMNHDITFWVPDVSQCGNNTLPTESVVIDSGDCRASISVFDATTKLDVDAATQEVVRDKISSLLSCL